MRYVLLAILLAGVAANAQDQEPRQWVDVHAVNPNGTLTKRLYNNDCDDTYVSEDGSPWTLDLYLSSEGASTWDYVWSSASGSFREQNEEPYLFTGILDDVVNGSESYDITIVAWGPECEEEDEAQPFKWVQVKIPTPTGDYGYNDTQGGNPMLPGNYTLDYDPVSDEYKYNGGTFEVRYSGSVGDRTFLITVPMRIVSSNGNGGVTTWRTFNKPERYTDVVNDEIVSPMESPGDAKILDWGDPYDPDDPDDPDKPEDDPDSDGDGEPDSTDPDDDDDGTPDDEEPPVEAPETGFDCIDEWLSQTYEGGFIDAIETIVNSAQTSKSYTITIDPPVLDPINVTISTNPDSSTAAGAAMAVVQDTIQILFKIAFVIFFTNKVILALRQF